MLTEYGKFLRKLRIDHSELLKDMSEKLNVTPSYLSAVETGKRSAPSEWTDILVAEYKLKPEQKQELRNLAFEAKKQIKINLNTLNDNEKNLVVSFARQFKELDDNDKSQILNILSGRKKS